MRAARRSERRRWLPLIALGLLAASGACGRPSGTADLAFGAGKAGLPVSRLLSGTSDEGFARATGPRELSFPVDHGPHPAFRTEWWYFTGILQGRDAAGRTRRFGYQFTVFRQALASAIPPRPSRWAPRDVFMGHLAVADIDGAPARPRFHAFQRFSRDGLALAGARARPFTVWVESWVISGQEARAARQSGAGGATGDAGAVLEDGGASVDIFPVQLRAQDGGRLSDGGGGPQGGKADDTAGGTAVALDLSVEAGRGPIAQGDRGWSVKGEGAGNASYYYSCTRLPTRGRLRVGDGTFEVTGTSWLDREWSTSALDADVVGWDWLGAHLDDGRDLMLYRLRTRAGRTALASRATVIDRAGQTRSFGPEAFALNPRGEWTSPDGRARYPAGFQLAIPTAPLQVTIRPLLADQELLLAVRYWEGAVTLEGLAGESRIGGSGYLELTGYVTDR